MFYLPNLMIFWFKAGEFDNRTGIKSLFNVIVTLCS